jgi:Zn-finger nucleic acid-binding protein/RNA polymerase subunit RPABC4/transcription elongation factor Spt4
MEAAVLHCGACGASVSQDALRCPYCASELATVACPHCLGLVSVHAAYCPRCGKGVAVAAAGPGPALDCPDCRIRLGASRVGGVDLESCSRCGGVWLAKGAFDRLAGEREERGAVLGALPGAAGTKSVALGAPVHYRPCPVCRKFMNRLNYGHVSGVILDVCKEDGLWFDRDELRRVLEFIEAGGLDKSRARELQDLEERRHQTVAEIPQGTWVGEPLQINRGGGLLEQVVRGLFGFSGW